MKYSLDLQSPFCFIRFCFQIPFPAVSYCPDLNRTTLTKHADCLLRGTCDGLNLSHNSSKLVALKTGLETCFRIGIDIVTLENKYKKELILNDWKENTYNDHLKTFLDPTWIDRQSFCMAGRPEIELRETLAEYSGLCFTLNPAERIFDERR